MKLSFETAKIVGVSSERSWSQVHTFFPTDSSKLEKRGNLLALVSLKRTRALGEIAVFGREVIARFHEEYFGSLEDSAFVRLGRAVQKVAEEVMTGFEIEIVAAVLVQGAFFLVIFGEGEVRLKRGEVLETIGEGEKGKIFSSSGYVQEGDFVFLSTSALKKNLVEGALKAALGGDSVEEAVEALTVMIYGKEEADSLAGQR
jgi:hypothetical protein